MEGGRQGGRNGESGRSRASEMNADMALRLLSIRSATEASRIDALVRTLSQVGAEATDDVREGLHALKTSEFDAVLACFPFPDWEPGELLEELQRAAPLTPVILHDAEATLAGAVRLTKLGAFLCLGPEMTPEELAGGIRDAARYQRDRRTALYGTERAREPWRRFLVGESRAMQDVMQVIRLIGPRRSTVLISGETGTGKEMVARAIHMASPRSHLPMVAVNCSALPENLLEAELFGHVKGAFTGAFTSRIGRFEQANRSTIFLDEIGDLPLDLQAKLLRVLQEREFQRLGSSETVKVDVRVLAASNVNLMERIREGRFREDLYYRLNVVPLPVPPLRARRRDIALLAHYFVDKICNQEDLPPRQVPPETIRRLSQYDWPGNVRQLENAIEMAIALSGDRTTLRPGDFPLPSIAESKPVPADATPVISVPDDGLDFERTVGRIERAILEQAMQKTGGNKKQAADMLGLKRTTFAAKLKSLSAAVEARAHACAAT